MITCAFEECSNPPAENKKYCQDKCRDRRHSKKQSSAKDLEADQMKEVVWANRYLLNEWRTGSIPVPN